MARILLISAAMGNGLAEAVRLRDQLDVEIEVHDSLMLVADRDRYDVIIPDVVPTQARGRRTSPGISLHSRSCPSLQNTTGVQYRRWRHLSPLVDATARSARLLSSWWAVARMREVTEFCTGYRKHTFLYPLENSI